MWVSRQLMCELVVRLEDRVAVLLSKDPFLAQVILQRGEHHSHEVKDAIFSSRPRAALTALEGLEVGVGSPWGMASKWASRSSTKMLIKYWLSMRKHFLNHLR
mmetsp:Transcript_5272/g.12159  ORF Transcript_5272/g.12159 Transcript_5272/m.12159 type:complete len:103 (+) Transcript_5272:984-1292(+)